VARYGERPVDEPTADPADADGAPHGGSGLVAERARRQGLVDRMRHAGREPYPYRFDRTHTVAAVRAEWPDLAPGTETSAEVAVAGRVVLKRDAGKLVFATIAERGAELQLFISKSEVGDEAFARVKELDRGDWVGAHGRVMTTRAGELSVKVDRLELLAKSIRPLPDKWHGLHDPDTRFRQRYVDLVVNAEARKAFDVRHEVLASFRRTLRARDYIEVETPILHVDAGGAHARPFATHHHTLDMELYLRVATELHLKRLIVGGMDRVFEIGRTFRNEGLSSRHNPEFTMMESYAAYADWTDVLALTEDLIRTAARDALGTTVVTIRGETVDLADEWPRRRMIDLVSEALGDEVHPSQPVERLRAQADSLGVRWEQAWGSGKLIEELFGATVEPGIVAPVFVTGHPVEISPLARVDRDDPYLTERFELFADSVELANGYSELNDPVEQRLRFEEEQRAKEAGDAERGSIDEDYLRALEYGMPPTGGLGVGIDRLVMMLAGVTTIRDVILFPTLRPEAAP
jgi:lysyl-tRNA synthetase, class II